MQQLKCKYRSAISKCIIYLLLLSFSACKSSNINNRDNTNSSINTTKIDNIPVSLKWSERMALSVIKRNPWMTETSNNASWGYTQGLVFYSLEQLWKKTGDKRYIESIKLYGQQMIDENGSIKGYKVDDYNLDNINAGKILFNLYALTKDERYRKAIEVLRQQLRIQPRTSDGGYWHKQKYPHQMWLDGAYMASPFLAQYAKTFGDRKAFDEVDLQFILMEKHMRDSKTGLLYHGWDESKLMIWANKQTGTSPNFWGRAMGWYAMAIVDVLDYFPKGHPKRKELIQVFTRLITALEKYQEPNSGLWYQVVDQGHRKGNYLEASASSMFLYAIAKAVRKGYLDKRFMAIAQKGYTGLINKLIDVKDNGEVNLLQVCEVAGLSADRDGSFEYYIKEPIRISDPKGTGPFILASLELNK